MQAPPAAVPETKKLAAPPSCRGKERTLIVGGVQGNFTFVVRAVELANAWGERGAENAGGDEKRLRRGMFHP